MSETKKYYWLKLKRDFFKRHDIEIIEGMPNGKDYVLFYLKLLVESIDHEGALRFSETLPYNEEMLATITRTNVDIVRSAVKIFSQLGMMDMMDDGTLYMRQLEGMVGDETEWAAKKRIYREQQKEIAETTGGQIETKSDKSKSIEKELDIDIDIDKEENNTSKASPSKSNGKTSDTSDNGEELALYHAIYDPILEKAVSFANYKKEGTATKRAIVKLKTKVSGFDIVPIEAASCMVAAFFRLNASGNAFWAELTPSKFDSGFEQIWAEYRNPKASGSDNKQGMRNAALGKGIDF